MLIQVFLRFSSFPRTTVKTEDSLVRKGLPENVMEMLLLGVVEGAEGKESNCDLLFMLTAPDEDRESLNTAQLGATILGSSRVIFYQHILDLLNTLDPSKAELAYLDTDSLVWYVAGDDISDTVLPQVRDCDVT